MTTTPHRAAVWPAGMPRHLSYPAVGVDALLAGAARAYGDRVALRDGEEALTFAKVYDQALRVARGLRERGVHPGDVVALYMPNSIGFVLAYYGALCAGAAVAPINPAQPEASLTSQLVDVGAKVVIADPSTAGVALASDATSVRFVACVPGRVPGADLPPGVITLDELAAGGRLEGYRADPELVAHLQLTGGTTGRSKAVRVLHRNIVANVLQNVCWKTPALPGLDAEGGLVLVPVPGGLAGAGMAPGTGVHIGIAPFFHGLGLVNHNADVLMGTTVVLAAGFSPDRLAADIEELGVTQLIGSPAMYYALLHSPELARRDLSSVRFILCGAAPIDTTALTRLGEFFTNASVMEGYGLSEATAGVASGPMGSEVKAPLGSIGIPLYDTEVEIRDEQGSVLPVGEVGELWVRGPQVTDGYQGEPELTANQFKEGWLATGDMGRRDEDGFLFLVGRSKDLILYKGYNVYPQPLEEFLCQHPAVAQAAVVGKPDQGAGEVPVAFVALRPGATPCPELATELMQQVAAKVAAYQKVREVHFIEALPATATGKVLKTGLRAQIG